MTVVLTVEGMKGLVQKNSPWIVNCSGQAGQGGQYACGQNVGAVGALFKDGKADLSRQNINLYSSSTSAAELFFICNLSLFLLLFAFLWYIDRCPGPTRLMCTAEGSRIFCRVKKVTRAPEIENRKSQTIRSWLNFNSIVCSHGNVKKK